MALYDNKHWLLSHIRNSFIAADDSGMCEVVMNCDNIARRTCVGKYDSYPGVEEDDDDDDLALGHSFDLNSDLQFHRRPRSNTTRRLQKLREEEKKAASTIFIKWENNPNPLTDEEREQLFPKKDMNKFREDRKNIKLVSPIAEMLAKYPSNVNNPFKNYAKVDGNSQVGSNTKKYLIFVNMLPEDERKYPMEVAVIASAKVMDLIGLICWKCTLQHPEITLKDNVSHYGLYIAEDDGDVDWDFPCLDSREIIAKFGFTYLALVERDTATQNYDDSSVIYFNESMSIQVPAEPTTSARAQAQKDDFSPVSISQTYNVSALNKVKVKADIYLEISFDKLDISPILSSSKKVGQRLWGNKPKAKSHSMDNVVGCQLTEHKSNSRSTFRIVYFCQKKDPRTGEPTGKFKSKDYESETRLASEIVKKINEVLDIRQSERRNEYIAMREMKSHKRTNFLVPR